MKISEQKKCLIGVCLQFFGQGFLFIWGKCNIYYYSYYKSKDPDLPYSYNYMIAVFLALPVLVLSITALPIANYCGFRALILPLAFVQLITTAISALMPNYPLFLFFYAFVNAIVYILQYYPSLKCLWSHYMNNEGKVLGIAFGVFNASIFTYLLFVTLLINPDDKAATLSLTEGNQTFKYFDTDVAQNVPKTVLALAFLTGTFNIIGSALINYNSQALQKPLHTQKVSEIELQQNIDLPIGNVNLKQSDPFSNKKELLTIMRSWQFLIFFCNKFTLMLYMVIFGINFKQYSLTKVNDDYFVTFVENTSILVTALTNILFGFLADHVDYKKLLLGMFFSVGIIGILFPVMSNHGRYYFALSFNGINRFIGLLLLNVLDMGLIVIIPPGIIKIFHQPKGVAIYPFINSGAKIALLLGPILEMVGLQFFDMDSLLMLCGCLIALASLTIFFLELQYEDVKE